MPWIRIAFPGKHPDRLLKKGDRVVCVGVNPNHKDFSGSYEPGVGVECWSYANDYKQFHIICQKYEWDMNKHELWRAYPDTDYPSGFAMTPFASGLSCEDFLHPGVKPLRRVLTGCPLFAEEAPLP